MPAISLSPMIAAHLFFALGSLVLGPLALLAPKGGTLHRVSGYVWVVLILGASLASIFIRDTERPNIGGYTAIHVLVPLTLFMLFVAFRKLAAGDVAGHRRVMRRLYVGACVVPGVLALLPHRFLGTLVFGQWLGVL